jgi:hypothetical protein
MVSCGALDGLSRASYGGELSLVAWGFYNPPRLRDIKSISWFKAD